MNRAIDSTIHLRRIAEFGGASKVSATATDQYVRKQRPARQQPKDLKPRFTPIGVPTTKPSAVPAQKSQASKPKPASSSSSSDSSDSDVEMTDAATLPVSAVSMKSAAATKAGSKLKRKQSTEDSDSDSDTSSSDSDDEPAPALEAKSKAKPAKRAKTAAEKKLEKLTTASAPAVQGENTRSSKSQLSLAEVKKATPVPPPSVVRTFSQASAANETPSKAPESSKDKKDKKSKKTAKSADGATTSIKQTPIPVPTWGKGN